MMLLSAAAAAAGSTWNPSDKDASVTLSNGNRKLANTQPRSAQRPASMPVNASRSTR